MNTSNSGRASTIFSRAALAIFLAALPGAEAAAQLAKVPVRIAPGAPLPSGVLAAPAVTLSPANAVLIAAPAALTAAPAAPVAVAPARAEAAPSAMSALAAAGKTGAPKSEPVSAQEAGAAFDGSASNGSASIPDGMPAQAPIMTISHVLFPDVVTQIGGFNQPELRAFLAATLKDHGGYMTLTFGAGAKSAAMLVKASRPDFKNGTFMVDALATVRIAAVKTVDGIPVAELSYPEPRQSDPQRMNELLALAQLNLALFEKQDPELDQEIVRQALKENNPTRLTHLLAWGLPLTTEAKQRILDQDSMEGRLQNVILEMAGHFKDKGRSKEQAAAPSDSDAPVDHFESPETLKAEMTRIGMPENIRKIAMNEFDKFIELNPKDAEAQKLRAYLQWLLEMPWSQRTEDSIDVAAARAALDKDHYGIQTVKERVLEFLAVRKKTGSKKGAIIALTGPPGVGKTSIARAISLAMGRKFVRLSLGGVSDESVLRGHGRTYLGSMPGEIMRQMKSAGTINPVMLLDEVDKLTRGDKGDPSAALLEVLDPEQNNTFRDRYLDVPYDLSEVVFVVTANELSNIPEPVRDRMEIIEFDGYTAFEKIEIARLHIIPQKLKEMGLTQEEAGLTRDAILRVIEGYTFEAGVRALRQKIGAVLRKISAWTEMKGEPAPGLVGARDIEKYLGVEKYSPRQTAQNGVGVATGLAVSGRGGSTLNVEVSKEPGTGQLRLRKQFGDDIEDSARNAYKYVKQNAAKLGLGDVKFQEIDVDINITPAGKVDGPSAGGLMVTAIVSALSNRPVVGGLAMTGEITMRGDILPIGGLKQKVMAAHRMGYTMVIFPWANRKDIEDLPEEVRDAVTLKAVKTYDEIYPLALAPAEDAAKK